MEYKVNDAIVESGKEEKACEKEKRLESYAEKLKEAEKSDEKMQK